MSGCTLTCCGGVDNATGANFLLKTPRGKLLVDCGLVQGSRVAQEENRDAFSYDPKEIPVLLITHAHMDHIGRIPKLVREGFEGVIYSTEETRDLATVMLADAQNLIAREARESGRTPIYEKEDVARALSLWKVVTYHQTLDVVPGISAFWKDAGHILGSAIIEIAVDPGTGADGKVGKPFRIAFTGDLGNSPTPLLRDTEYVNDADYMVIESVYGDRNHEPKAERDEKFARILKESLRAGGTVLIPAFSLERTQVMLYKLNNLVEAGELPKVPVYMDSPLGSRVTEIYRRHVKDFNIETQKVIAGGDDIFDFAGLRIVEDAQASAQIHSVPGAKIIIAGSGMSVGGRVLAHERVYLSDPKATVVLVGFQVPGSIGRRIEEKSSNIVIDGQRVKVRCRIEKVGGYSSHKDSNGLVDFVAHAMPRLKKVFVAMGENKSSTFLAQRMNGELGANAVVPEKNVEYPL
ncbi:MAG: MBL fold metallo-hydrolase [bacterium]|nr:MBL fold metallo-hydrolase [bacterium]